MRQDEACIEAIVRYELRQRLSQPPENVMVEFDNRERRRDRAIGPDPHGHLALDRPMREVVETQSLAGLPDFAFEEAPSDRPLHPEMLRHAQPSAANLIADETIAGRDPKLRNRVLDLVSGAKGEVEIQVGETCSWLPRPVVAPLPFG